MGLLTVFSTVARTRADSDAGCVGGNLFELRVRPAAQMCYESVPLSVNAVKEEGVFRTGSV